MGALTWPQVRTGQSVDATSPSVVVIERVERVDDAYTFDTTVTSVRPSDGATLWQWHPAPSSSGPLYGPLDLLDVSATTLFYRTFDDYSPGNVLDNGTVNPHLYALSLATGRILWQRVLATANPDDATETFAGNDALYYETFFVRTPWILLALDAGMGVPL